MNYLDIMRKRHEAFMRELDARHKERMWQMTREYLKQREDTCCQKDNPKDAMKYMWRALGERKLPVKCECNELPFR